ncbi:MAG TPA: DUF3105 domain-containing protein [Roseiflexaceae bacterium]|nr:DUF3105 domain-containing protein [Roseiflexaceae bacterium]
MSQSSVRRTGGRQVQRKKASSNRTLMIAVAVGLVVVMVVAGLALTRSGGGNIAGQQQFPNLVPPPTSPHIAEVTSPHGPYNSNPPTSGWHYGGGTAPWGVQSQPIPDELTVHNLEHGGVIIHYRQGLDQASVDQLTSLARELQQQSPCIVLLPRPADKMTESPIAVTAWTWLLRLDTVDAGKIRSFFRAHIDQAPEHVGCQLRS